MRLLPVFLLTWALVSSGAAASVTHPGDEAQVWLERLSAPSAAERDRAQRWLAVHLVRDDYAALARAAMDGDAELRRRLGDALAADGRHLTLGALLLVEEDGVLAALGAKTVDELVSEWCPGAARRRASRGSVITALVRLGEHRFEIAAGAVGVPRLAARLARLGDLGIPLVVDPRLEGRAARSLPGWTGTACGLLAEVAHADRLSLSGVGDWDGEQPGEGAFVLVGPRGGAREIGSDLLRSWCASLPRADERAPAAARALAASGWPAALAWLERSWFARDHSAALDGLLLAAGRGRIAPALCLGEGRRRVIAAADEGLVRGDAAGRRRAAAVARALARAGSLSPVGDDLAPLLLEGWDRNDAPRIWVRLTALEGRSVLAPAVLARVVEVGEGPDAAPAMRMAALRVLAGLTRPPEELRLPDLARLWAWTGERGARGELLDLLEAIGGVDPDDPAVPAPVRFDALARGELGAEALALLMESLADPATPTTRREWVHLLTRRVEREGATRAGRLLEPGFGAAGDPAGKAPGESSDEPWGEALMGLALEAGCLAPAFEVQLFERLRERHASAAGDLLLLGELGAGPRGSSARDLLLARLEELAPSTDRDLAASEELARALTAAARRLAEVRRDDLLLGLVQAVRIATADPVHPLHLRLAARAWPPPRLPRATRLSALERVLP
ncbi:MAG: hypothetical protein VYE81_07535 [Planctomycetota bacterium]|nr:hypothetical protein [Planctomycetota bacterium]